MKQFLALLLTVCLVVPLSAQKKPSVQKKATTTVSKRQSVKKTGQQKTTTKRTSKKNSAKNQTRKQAPVTVQGLKNQRQQLQKQMKEQERRLRQTEKDVKARLQNLMVINTEIDDKRKVIDTIRRDITTLDGNIHILDGQLKVFDKELFFVFIMTKYITVLFQKHKKKLPKKFQGTFLDELIRYGFMTILSAWIFQGMLYANWRENLIKIV